MACMAHRHHSVEVNLLGRSILYSVIFFLPKFEFLKILVQVNPLFALL